MSKSTFKRKMTHFDLTYRNYLLNSVHHNTLGNIQNARAKNDDYNHELLKYVTTFDNSDEAIIGDYFYRLLFSARKDPETYAKDRIEILNSLFSFVSHKNRNWFSLWITIQKIFNSLAKKGHYLQGQMDTEILDMFRLNMKYPKMVHGLINNHIPILKTPVFYFNNQLLKFVMYPNTFGRKKTKLVQPIQYLALELFSYLSKSYGFYSDETQDLLPSSGINYSLINDIKLPRKLADLDQWVDLINGHKRYTMNPFGVVVECYNAGDIDQIILWKNNGGLVWKIHFKSSGWTLDNHGYLIDDNRGCDYCGFFTNDFMPYSLFSVHSDFIEFEYSLYEFVLECYADIICGMETVNKSFTRSAVNVGTLNSLEIKSEIKSIGFRYIPRRIYNTAKSKKSPNEKKTYLNKFFVTGHVRKLPDGQTASPSATNNALEFGIDLPDGYTFVRPYESGEERVRTHYIKKI